MTMDELYNFLKVIETGSATAAAAELYISRQGLRNAISSLEKELGAPLLRRSSRGFALTEFGRYFAAEALPVTASFQSLAQSYERFLIKTEKTINITMGQMSFPWTRLVREIARDFELVYPQYQVEYQLADYFKSAVMDDGTAEVVLLQTAKSIEGCAEIMLIPTEYLVCVGKDHPLFSRENISFEDIKEARFVTRSRDTYAYEWLHTSGVSDEKIIFDSNNPDVKRIMLESGSVIGFSSVDYQSSPDYYSGSIRQVHMSPPILVTNSLYVRQDVLQRKDAIQAFWRFAENFLEMRKRKQKRE